MAEINDQSAPKKRRSTGNRSVQYSLNVELPRDQEIRMLGIKDRVKMAKGTLNLTKATCNTQNADLLEALLLAFEEKMLRRRETSILSSATSMNQSSSSAPANHSPSTQPFPMPIATSTPRSRTSLPFTDSVFDSPIQSPYSSSADAESSASFRPQKFQVCTQATEDDPIYLCSEGALRSLFSFFTTKLLAKCCFCGNLLQPDSLSFNRQGHAVSVNIFCLCGDSMKWLSSPIMGGPTPKYYVNMRYDCVGALKIRLMHCVVTSGPKKA